jgi:hypothetical protein
VATASSTPGATCCAGATDAIRLEHNSATARYVVFILRSSVSRFESGLFRDYAAD